MVLSNEADTTFLPSGVKAHPSIMRGCAAIVLISNPRSGVAVAINQIMEIGYGELALLIVTVLISSVFGYYLTIKLTKPLIGIIKKLNYQKLSLYVFIFINLIIFAMTGFIGLIISTTALCIGLIPNLIGIRRTWSMGCLLLPTIVWFL